MYKGIGASGGIGIGKVIQIRETELDFAVRESQDSETEKKRLAAAMNVFCSKTKEKAESIRERAGDKEAEILEGQLLMIQDPSMQDEINRMIQEGKCAEEAVATACDMFILMFSSVEDELTQQRATDIADLKARMLEILLGVEELDLSCLPSGTILVAHDLTPSMTAGIDRKNVCGIITETGGMTSHSAILARALGIPAVLSVVQAMDFLTDGIDVIVDGNCGIVLPSPDGEQVKSYVLKQEELQRERQEIEKYKGKKTVTNDGTIVELVANIGNPKDVQEVLDGDGEGVGLFRTEFLFMDREGAPSEEEQFQAYREVAEKMGGRPVIIRTLDVGGDKEIPYLGLEKEENPFLGYRAIRFCLGHKQLYQSQLRALLRASHYGNISIMIPLITCIEELREVKKWIDDLKQELDATHIPYARGIRVGVMIETPAACQIADLLAKEADFFSIGTNDLTSYTMAADRGNAEVASLNSYFQPAVLRSIRSVIRAGKEAGIMVGMCGEAAADVKMIPLLLAFGLEEFSVNPVSVLKVRAQIHKWSMEQAECLTEKVMAAATEKEVLAAFDE